MTWNAPSSQLGRHLPCSLLLQTSAIYLISHVTCTFRICRHILIKGRLQIRSAFAGQSLQLQIIPAGTHYVYLIQTDGHDNRSLVCQSSVHHMTPCDIGTGFQQLAFEGTHSFGDLWHVSIITCWFPQKPPKASYRVQVMHSVDHRLLLCPVCHIHSCTNDLGVGTLSTRGNFYPHAPRTNVSKQQF